MKTAELFDVRGLATIVTGGASGIGLGIATALADNGARVTLLDLKAPTLDAAVEKLRKAGGDVRGEIADVTDAEGLQRAVDAAAALYGRLDVVFANAGIDGGPGFVTPDQKLNEAGAIENFPEQMWDKVIATNLTSVFHTIRSAVRHMKPQKSGSIIVTTSVAAMKAEPVVGVPYMPAKAGAAHLVRQVALELARYNIRVNAIAPGPFVTGMMTPSYREIFEKQTPLGRAASTDEMQGLALFLASRASSFVTGAQIAIDGGTSLFSRSD